MEHREAVALIRDGVSPGGVWADLGAGGGVFTRALLELLGPEGAVYAVDRDEAAVRALQRLEREVGSVLIVRRADFTQQLTLPRLDGVLMANALHYVRDQERLLRQLTELLVPGGRLLLVEYDQQQGNPWVPYPIPPARFRALAERVGFLSPKELARRRSAFGREMYAAVTASASPET